MLQQGLTCSIPLAGTREQQNRMLLIFAVRERLVNSVAAPTPIVLAALPTALATVAVVAAVLHKKSKPQVVVPTYWAGRVCAIRHEELKWLLAHRMVQ